ncbi:MAG: Gfo/Idh/MocA family oxidoreductase [Rhodothermales bacterium]
MSRKNSSRRDFLRLAAASGAAAGFGPAVLASNRTMLQPKRKTSSANDRINLATIGTGIIGFIDTDTALAIPGVQLVAASDAYDSRLCRIKEYYGNDVFTSMDYREVLARPDVDAVIISVPDHWHARMAIDAMAAGKDIYLEKPMVQDLADGLKVIDAQNRTKRIVQVGSQFKSDAVYDKVKELYESGAIGTLNMVQAQYNRNSSLGAWQYSIPTNVSAADVNWDAFLGEAPKRPFDPVRFFRWRNYRDYGTGIPGDLFVHLFTGINHVLSSNGPNLAMAQGGLRYWLDGRDVPDVILAIYEYPETSTHPAFTLSMQSNFADGSGGGTNFQFIGNEGVISVGDGGLKLTQAPMRDSSVENLVDGYNSVRTWCEEEREAFAENWKQEHPGPQMDRNLGEVREFEVPGDYDSRFDHFANFFDGVRTRTPAVEDAVVGFRAAAPALLANMSYFDKRIYRWDPDAMKLAS